MSFVNEHGFAGVAVIDVDDDDARDEEALLRERFSHEPRPDAGYAAAAARKAWDMGCNPGGQVQLAEIDATRDLPRNRLMQRPELKALGAI